MFILNHIKTAFCTTLLIALLVVSCSDKGTNNHGIAEGDYHLIYGPVFLTDLKLHTYTYSTRTGERIDTSTGTDLYYSDLLYTRSGNMAVYTGRHQSLRQGPRVTWVTTYPTGDTLAIKEGIGGKTVYLNISESNALLFSYTGFTILTFPSLDLIYQDSVDAIGGFLTSPAHIYYLDTLIDTIFALNYGNPDSIKINKIPLVILDSELAIRATAVDNNAHLLYILRSNDFVNRSEISIYDSDSLKFLKNLAVSRDLDALSIAPTAGICFFFASGMIGSEFSHIDKYFFAINKLESFLEPADIQIPDPFQPHHIEFTPDNNEMFILTAGGLWGPSPIIGININDKTITQYLKSDTGQISTFRINPINWSK